MYICLKLKFKMNFSWLLLNVGNKHSSLNKTVLLSETCCPKHYGHYKVSANLQIFLNQNYLKIN